MITCPNCGEPLKVKKVPFSFKGHSFGFFEAFDCKKCGEYFLTEDSAKRIQEISKEKGLFGTTYSLREVILLLIGARKKAIAGTTTLIKEIFLMCTENPLNLNFEEMFSFEPHKYGPYLFEFPEVIKNLVESEIITIEDRQYSLTEVGEQIFNELTKFWDGRTLKRFQKIRKSWDQKGTYGLMKYIYENYPMFKEKSEVLDRFRE